MVCEREFVRELGSGLAEAIATTFHTGGAIAVSFASDLWFIFGSICTDRVLSADLTGGAFAVGAAGSDASILATDFTRSASGIGVTASFAGFCCCVAVFAGSTSSVGSAALLASFCCSVAVFTGSTSSVGSTTSFASSGIAVLSSTTSSVRGTGSGFALCVFADLARSAVFVATAARFASARFTDFSGSAVSVTGTLCGSAFAVGTGLTARTIVGAFATVCALAGDADLSEFAFFVASAGGESFFASTAGADFSFCTVSITTTTFCTGGSGCFADRADFAVSVGATSVGFATTFDTELTVGAIVIGFATLAALILATHLTARTFGIGAATIGASTREADFSRGAVFVSRAFWFGWIGGFGCCRSAVGVADPIAAIAGAIQVAILCGRAVGAAGAFHAGLVGSAVCIAATLRRCVGIDGTTTHQADFTHGAMGIAETVILALWGGFLTAAVGIPGIDIAVTTAMKTTKAAREEDGGCKEKAHK